MCCTLGEEEDEEEDEEDGVEMNDDEDNDDDDDDDDDDDFADFDADENLRREMEGKKVFAYFHRYVVRNLNTQISWRFPNGQIYRIGVGSTNLPAFHSTREIFGI